MLSMMTISKSWSQWRSSSLLSILYLVSSCTVTFYAQLNPSNHDSSMSCYLPLISRGEKTNKKTKQKVSLLDKNRVTLFSVELSWINAGMFSTSLLRKKKERIARPPNEQVSAVHWQCLKASLQQHERKGDHCSVKAKSGMKDRGVHTQKVWQKSTTTTLLPPPG